MEKGKRGFLSFLLSSLLLLALVSSGARLSSWQPDLSYERYAAYQQQELAIKSAFYAAASESASRALALAIAEGREPRPAVREAVFLQAVKFEKELSESGYSVIFWCGEIPEQEKPEISSGMALEKHALAPPGSLPLSGCADSFDTDVLQRKLRFFGIGFSLYSEPLGIGRVAALPSSYEVDY